MHIALIGFGLENQAAYRHLTSRGDTVTICDQDTSVIVPNGAQSQLGKTYLDKLERFDLIVRTVGMHRSVILEQNPGVEDKITTAVNLFFETCTTPIIGITGTKGKGTTSTLVHKILEAAGKKTVLAGNIGVPMLDMLTEANASDFAVLELSSFQLYDVKYSPHIATCLMVVPEHLNWHADMEDYKFAKANLFKYQNSDDVAIYNAFSQHSEQIAAMSSAKTKISYGVPHNGEDTYGCAAYVRDGKIWYNGTEIMPTSSVKLLGAHNLENVCAAIATTWNVIEGNIEAITSVVSTFAGLEYRLQLIRELNGVKYFNDSFSTTPETAIAALKSFSEPKVVILGGSDKGIPFDELADTVVSSNTKHVLAIGDTGPVIANLLQNRNYSSVTTAGLDSMQAIVTKAQEIALEGDIVLLSTGCASFGMFQHYKDRGDQFNQAVQALT